MASIEPFDAVDLIKTKRDGGTLSTPQITWLVDAYTRGYVADEQMSALAMAICPMSSPAPLALGPPAAAIFSSLGSRSTSMRLKKKLATDATCFKG